MKIKLSLPKIFFSPRIMNIVLLLALVFSLASVADAIAPNPGHNFSEVGGNAAQGDILYGSAVDTLSALPKNTSATRYLSNTGVSNNPAWDQVNLSNGVTGNLPVTNLNSGTGASAATFWQGNGTWSNVDLASAEIAGILPLASGGTNANLTPINGGIIYSGASALGVSAAGTSGQILQSAGAASPQWSTATYPATAGTAGSRLVSNGTNFIAVDTSPHYLYPQGFSTTAAAVTTTVTNSSYFLYLGKIPGAVTSCNVSTRVTTAAATITWAEIGIFKGTPPTWGGTASLTRLGFTNVAATFNTTGVKTTAVTVSGSTAGDNLWVAYGSQANTPFQVAGATGDNSQSGVFQSLATSRISTIGVPVTTALSATTLVAGWFGVRCS